MANIFAGSEIVELGILIEKNGRDFYDVLANKTKNKKAKDVFNYLKGEEEKHINVFQNILDSVQKYKVQEVYSGDYSAYMNALASEYVFTKKDQGAHIAKKIASDKEAVEIGIGFEKDSILFYEGMKKLCLKSDIRALNALIAQEQDHLRRLSELKGTL